MAAAWVSMRPAFTSHSKVDRRGDRPSIERACPRLQRDAFSFDDGGLLREADEFNASRGILARVVRGVHWEPNERAVPPA